MKIFGKILITLLILSIIPLVVMAYMGYNNANNIGKLAVKNTKDLGVSVANDAEASLNLLGETILRQKAEDVAKQMEIYIKDHPEMTIPDLQQDETFFALGTQSVGETGYTTAWDAATIIDRFHYSPHIMNVDLHGLAEKLPSFWKLVGPEDQMQVRYGYYDFVEADGSIRQKYMHILPVDAVTADGVILVVAATTYIDEFNKPASEIAKKINENISGTQKNISGITNKMTTQNIVIFVIVLIVVIIVGFLFARGLSKPLIKLKKAAEKVTEGNFDVDMPKASKDEVGELIAAIEMLLTAFKNKNK